MKSACRPILFSGPMVLAIIDGRKTQTRRIVKPQPSKPYIPGAFDDDLAWPHKNGMSYTVTNKPHGPYGWAEAYCPFGKAGDRLWVKETWRPAYHAALGCCVQYAADSWYSKPKFADEDRGLRFADMCEQSGDHAEPWHSPIHMWREMSRVTLELVAVRAERLQCISEADAISEGVQTERDHYGGAAPLRVNGSVAWHRYDEQACSAVSAVESYRTLWDSINGKGSWSTNPWVWVVEFSRREVRP